MTESSSRRGTFIGESPIIHLLFETHVNFQHKQIDPMKFAMLSLDTNMATVFIAPPVGFYCD